MQIKEINKYTHTNTQACTVLHENTLTVSFPRAVWISCWMGFEVEICEDSACIRRGFPYWCDAAVLKIKTFTLSTHYLFLLPSRLCIWCDPELLYQATEFIKIPKNKHIRFFFFLNKKEKLNWFLTFSSSADRLSGKGEQREAVILPQPAFWNAPLAPGS